MGEKKLNVLFDYKQIEYSKSRRGDYLHAYNLAKNLSGMLNLYGVRFCSDPNIIHKETGVIVSSKMFLKFAPLFLNSLIQFFSVIFNKTKIDIVYTRTSYFLPRRIGFWYSLLWKKPLIVELNGLAWQESNKLIFKIHWLRKLILYQFRIADQIICVSGGIKEGLLKEVHYDSKKIIVINNGVDVDLFKPLNKSKLRKKYNLPKEKLIILFGGAIEEWQGLDLLIQTARKLEKSFDNFLFLIAGEGSYKMELIKKINSEKLDNFFVFTGSIDQKKLVEYINISDLCIAPFVKERKASPIKILEYLSCGRITLATPIRDIENLWVEGLFFEQRSPNRWSKKILSLFKLERISKEKDIRRKIIKNYSWNKTAGLVFKEIESVIDRLNLYQSKK